MKIIIQKNHRKNHYESVKCQYCGTYAETNEEVNEKFGFKENGEIYRRCKKCMNNLYLWKE